ncbi:glutamate--tRNA ligase [Camelimonas abortus]|uniref:Glutamate--tRNA ligase n=1 Tax=Camelimonas abortus TaxID=1017184 RepID=A0ABV7LFI4_9HYPH
MIVRFAPSPTGYLHIGNARTALLNALLARREGGRFILRLDDTDRARSREEYADAIREDLAWLGVTPDAVFRQSQRGALYEAAAARLRAAGRLYPCYETAGELERRRRLQLARGLPPVYDRAALKLTAAERAALEAQGRRPHWRFLLHPETVVWNDLVRGESRVDCASLSDPVLVREDGAFLYTLPSVVDDADMGVTHVIRGEDHVTNTAVQIQLFAALGAPSPLFGHHNLLVTADGEGLSKRQGHLSLRGLRERGVEPLAAAALAVLVGTPEAVRPVASLDELASLVDLGSISRAPARFDERELLALNARLLHDMPWEVARPRLAAAGAGLDEAGWLAVRGNLERFSDAAVWAAIIRHGPQRPPAAGMDDAFRAAALETAPPEPWNDATWKVWTGAIRERTGARGRALFMPLRLALTGRDHGPEMAALLPLIGREEALRRIRAAM